MSYIDNLVSIIMPCYNASQFLNEAIESILNQTYTHLELLIIDDGSEDDSLEICKSYASQDSRIRLIENHQNAGVVFSLNKGINEAKGEYLARMDADDISLPERIEQQIQFLNENSEIGIVGTKALAIDLESKPLKNNSIVYTDWQTLAFSAHFTQPLFHGSVLGKTELFKKFKYGNDSKAEDFELWLRMISNGIKIANLNQVYYQYRINPQSVSRLNELEQIEDHNEISKLYLERRFNQKFSTQMISILNNRPLEFVTYAQYIKAISQFEELFEQYEVNQQEVYEYYIRQKLDINLQCLKKAKGWLDKIRLLLHLLGQLKKPTALNYLNLKFHKA